MRLSSRACKVAAISASAVCVVLFALSAVFQQRPIGLFGSYKMLPHESGDVLRFTNGVVSHETCCGQEFLGSYKRLPDRTWMWHYSTGKKKVYTNYFVLKPGLFWLTCIDAKEPTNTWRLPRRLFPPKEPEPQS